MRPAPKRTPDWPARSKRPTTLRRARVEAEKALGIRIFVDPLLLLARLDLRDNKMDSAALSVDRALKLDPANSSAQTLKRAVAAKLAEKAPPVTN